MLTNNPSLHLPPQPLNRLQLIPHALPHLDPPRNTWIDLPKQRRHPLQRLLRHRTGINPTWTHCHNLNTLRLQLDAVFRNNRVHHRFTGTIRHHPRDSRLQHKLRIRQPRRDMHNLPPPSLLNQRQEGISDVDRAPNIRFDRLLHHIPDMIQVFRVSQLARRNHGCGAVEESAVVD